MNGQNFIAKSSPPMWYKAPMNHSLENDFQEIELNALTESSTPLQVKEGNQSISASPLRRLENLNLGQFSSEIMNQKSVRPEFGIPCGMVDSVLDTKLLGSNNQALQRVDEADEVENDEDLTSNAQSLTNDIKSFNLIASKEIGDTIKCELNCGSLRDLNTLSFPKKRKFIEPSAESVIHIITSPKEENLTQPSSVISSVTPICTNDLDSKLSFSLFESTPCPSQPRKRLRVDRDLFEKTPTSRSKNGSSLLNFSSSKKLSIKRVPLFNNLNSVSADTNSSFCHSEAMKTFLPETIFSNTTPISQSTPCTSSVSSPSWSINLPDEEACFVTPDSHPKIRHPETHQDPLCSNTDKKNSNSSACGYRSGSYLSLPIDNYQIIGDFPITSAGLMDETKWSVHIADKRINDPYLSAPSSPSISANMQDLFLRYTTSENKLPLLEHQSKELRNDEMKYLIDDGKSVRHFYEMIQSSSKLTLNDLLKKERLRWHPDKWEKKIKDTPLDIKIIISLSQVINKLISEL